MSPHAISMLERLGSSSRPAILPRLRAILRSPATQVLSGSSATPSASRLTSLWQTRYRISEAQGSKIAGLPDLLKHLEEVPASHPVEQFSIVGTTEVGTVFFDVKSGSFLGAVLVEMSEHTRKYFQGQLTGDPVNAVPEKRRHASIAPARTRRPKGKPVVA